MRCTVCKAINYGDEQRVDQIKAICCTAKVNEVFVGQKSCYPICDTGNLLNFYGVFVMA